jgi:nucleotide-binding universal stress UspA family protein
MRERDFPSSSVVVGIDGSRAAVRAALWAVDAAVSRDIPLRLICAISPDATAHLDPQSEARKLATAELAVRYAFMAVESTEKPVKIEVEIVQGPPTRTLIEASWSAAVIYVGSVGVTHFAADRVGSTAANLASSAHCPVAIIRGRDRPSADHGAVLVNVTSPNDGAVVQAALDEARLRGLPLQAVATWQSRFTDSHDNLSVSLGNHDARAQLERVVDPLARRYPDVAVSCVAVHGNLLSHLAKNSDSIQLVVMGAHDSADVVGPAGNAILHSTDCSVLIVSRRHL